MPKYKCINESCEQYMTEFSEQRSRITMVNGTPHDRNDWCPHCKQKRIVVRESGMLKNISGTNDQINRHKKNGDPY